MKILEATFKDITSDHKSGSSRIQNLVQQALSDFCQRTNQAQLLSQLDYIKELITRYKSSLNQFAVVTHFLEQFEIALANRAQSGLQGKSLDGFILSYQKEWEGVEQKTGRKAYELLELQNKTILVCSQSQTVVSLLGIAGDKSISVIQTESRPCLEGRAQARTLVELGFEVTLITDSAVSRFADAIDLFIAGADSIHPAFFVNKIGTQAISLICKANEIPIYVIADSRKIRNQEPGPIQSELPKPESEVWEDPPSGIKIQNYYFESIPNELITGFITEKGFFDPGQQISQ